MLVSEIQNETIFRLGPGARTTAAQLIPSIDEANRRIYNKLVKVHERLFYGTGTFRVVSGQNEYTVSADSVPSDIKRILKLETRYADQDKRVRATKIDLSHIDQMEKATTTYHSKNRPGYYWMGNGTNTVIGFDPAHDVSADNYTKVWYLKQPTRLTNGNQTPIIPEDAHYLIVAFALAMAQLSEDEDANTHLAFLNRWDRDVDDWIESELPGVLEQQFTVDAEDEEEPL